MLAGRQKDDHNDTPLIPLSSLQKASVCPFRDIILTIKAEASLLLRKAVNY